MAQNSGLMTPIPTPPALPDSPHWNVRKEKVPELQTFPEISHLMR